jgi:hypothetical protein
MKAWSCMDYGVGCGVIVLAETRGKARALARAGGLDGSEWVDVSVTRLPELDGIREVAGALDWQADERVYWEAGWWCEDPGCASCDTCGRYVYEGIPESRVVVDESGTDQCLDCLAGFAETGEDGEEDEAEPAPARDETGWRAAQ